LGTTVYFDAKIRKRFWDIVMVTKNALLGLAQWHDPKTVTLFPGEENKGAAVNHR